jgi:hypothetical protein
MLVCACVAVAGGGCGLLRRKPVKREESVVREMWDGRRPLGQIILLDRNHEFVLLRSPLAESLKESTLLVAKDRAGNTTGKLKVSPEKKRIHVAADIAEGSPRMGDVVFMPSDLKPTTTAPPADAAVEALPAASAGADPGVVPPAGPMDESLPPLGEPSGPRETVPDFSESGEAPR